MKTCVITGATSGIGKATAIELSKLNDYDRIVILGRKKEELEQTQKLMDISKKISYKILDLTELKKIPNIVKEIIKENETIDCLINVAGYTEPAPLLTTSIENLKTTYDVNVFAPIILMREVVRYMKDNKDGGKILNVASTAGMTPRPGWLSYASSKAAIISASDTLSHELEEYNIRVYCVSPGRCATALRKKLAPDEDPTTIMQPQEVSSIICSLISNNEQCLDGQNIVIRKKI